MPFGALILLSVHPTSAVDSFDYLVDIIKQMRSVSNAGCHGGGAVRILQSGNEEEV